MRIEIGYVFGEKMGRIIEQDFRGSSFNSGSNTFTASNGFMLTSEAFVDSTPLRLFVRGSDTRKEDLFKIPSEVWLGQLRVAVREFNQMRTPSARTEIIE